MNIKQWKVFLLSLTAQFMVVSLLHLGVSAPRFLDFLSFSQDDPSAFILNSPFSSKIDLLDSVRLRLEQKITTFKLKKVSSQVGAVLAAADYDQASGYAVVNLDDGMVLAGKNETARLPIASLTKIMTAAVALDLALPEERFTVTPQAAVMEPTKIGVVAGQTMTLEELLNASLLTSANDAVEVIKEGLDQKYGGDIFIRALNEKARILGLKNTHFDNAQGLDGPGNFSSAEDLAVLSHFALENYPLIAQIAKKDYQFLPPSQYHKQFDLYNWNGLLGVYPGVSGLKIGNTDSAGFTTAVVSEREGQKILVILLGAPGVLERDLWAAELLDIGFEKLGLPAIKVDAAKLKQKYSTWKYWN